MLAQYAGANIQFKRREMDGSKLRVGSTAMTTHATLAHGHTVPEVYHNLPIYLLFIARALEEQAKRRSKDWGESGC
jgi:hypothetical protein